MTTTTAPTTRRKRELTNTYPLTIGTVTIHETPQSVATLCPYCGAAPGQPCQTKAGTVAREGSHRARWREFAAAIRGGRFYVELYRDDPRFGLSKGDVLLAQSYRYDLEKVTIVHRVSDGFDPECNQYHHDVIFLSFVA